MSPQAEDLIYSPAKRRGVGLLIMLAGPPGSGKTKSALRLATGLAGGGQIDVCDTEHGRALYYADEFSFNHLELKEPFRPSRFEAAAVISQQRKSAVWVCDSFSHEHVGPGGILDMFEENLQRMTKGDVGKREQLKYTAWIAPKGEHKHLLQRLWQLNTHIILCCHAEKKLDLVKNRDGKTVPNPDALPSPVCAPDIPYAMTCSLLFDAKRPGVPSWLKRFDKLEPLISTGRLIDEETGRRLAAWAGGAHAAPIGKPPASEEMFPGDAPLFDQPSDPATSRTGRNEQVLVDLIRQFDATVVRADHLGIVDQKENRDRIAWFKHNKPEMFARLRAAQEESWARTDPAKQAEQQQEKADAQ